MVLKAKDECVNVKLCLLGFSVDFDAANSWIKWANLLPLESSTNNYTDHQLQNRLKVLGTHQHHPINWSPGCQSLVRSSFYHNQRPFQWIIALLRMCAGDTKTECKIANVANFWILRRVNTPLWPSFLPDLVVTQSNKHSHSASPHIINKTTICAIAHHVLNRQAQIKGPDDNAMSIIAFIWRTFKRLIPNSSTGSFLRWFTQHLNMPSRNGHQIMLRTWNFSRKCMK